MQEGRHPPSSSRVIALLAALELVASAARADGPFVGQFELKTLESEAGYLELQSQNAYAFGHPPRGVQAGAAGDDGVLYDQNSVTRLRSALEAELGFSRRFKGRVGLELEDERIEEPAAPAQAEEFEGLALTEVGAEVIAVLLPREGDGFGAGVVVEYEQPILSAADESSKLIVGPVLEGGIERWTASAIPMLVHAFRADAEAGEPSDNKWDFAYAVQVAYAISRPLEATLEAYGTVDRLGDSGRRSAAARAFGDFDQHRLGPVFYYGIPLSGGRAGTASGDALVEEDDDAQLSFGLGLLVGLGSNTSRATLKLSLELDL